MYYRSCYSSSVSFHQDAADASSSGYIPYQPAQSGISGDVKITGTQGPHVPMNELMAHSEKQAAPPYFEDNPQSGTYLEETFGKESVKSLPFQDPSDPVIKSAPRNSNPPVHIVKQKLFIPYHRTKRTLQERSKNPLPSPTFFNCDDGTIGVSLGRAKQGHGLAMNSNHPSPLGDRQTLRLKIWIYDTAKPDLDKQLATAHSPDLKRLMRSIAKHIYQLLSTGPYQVGNPDDYVLIGYTFVSKGAIMPIFRCP